MCVLVDDLNKNSVKNIFAAGAMPFSCMYILAVGDALCGKRHTSRTIAFEPLPSYLGRKLTSTAIFLVLLVLTGNRLFGRVFHPEKRLRDERYKHISTNLKNVRVLAPPMLFNVELRRCCLPLNFGDSANHSHSDRCQPLTDRKERRTSDAT